MSKKKKKERKYFEDLCMQCSSSVILTPAYVDRY